MQQHDVCPLHLSVVRASQHFTSCATYESFQLHIYFTKNGSFKRVHKLLLTYAKVILPDH